MASLGRPRKHRSSTTRSHAPPLDEPARKLEEALESLKRHESAVEVQAHAASQTLASFGSSPDVEGLQDHFRRLHGFQTLLTSIRELLARLPSDANLLQITAIVDLLAQYLRIVLVALHDHEGNRRYFQRRVEGGGWLSIRETFVSIGKTLSHIEPSNQRNALLQVLVDVAITVALDDTLSGEQSPATDDLLARYDEAIIVNVEILPLLFSLVRPTSTLVENDSVACSALKTVQSLISSSSRNKLILAASDMSETLLDMVMDNNGLAEEARELVMGILSTLLNANAGSLKVAERLFIHATSDEKARLLLENALSQPQDPPATHFDLSLQAHSALEIPSLPRAFPPPTGYTFAAWCKIDCFDARQHTTLFGAFDVTQTCFLLTYLERGSQQLILQTSVTSASPSVRFKRFRFETGLWYHVVIVHRPPKSGDFGEATLFVDGRLVDRKENCLYPQPAPYHDNNLSSAPFPPESNVRLPVQAFFGTPQDLSAGPKERKAASRWSLATAHVYDCCLPKDLISVQHALGPSYSGNFQDRIGQLLTYDASAALNRYNEEIYGEKAEKSGIATAIQKRGIDFLHEGGNLLSIFSAATVNMDGIFSKNFPLSATLSEPAVRQLQAITRSGNTILINAYRPSISEALLRPSGVGVLTGRAFVSIPRGLDDASWQLGGFLSIQVKLIESATSPKALLSSIRTLFRCIKHKFRASEAMERDQGYSVVALLIRDKLGLSNPAPAQPKPSQHLAFATIEQRNDLMYDLLLDVLEFLGIPTDAPHTALLKNPLAYRSFLTDLDTWRMGSPSCQRLCFQQISWLLSNNTNQDFNARRLVKMRVTRKFLDCLRCDYVHESNLDAAMNAMRSLYTHVAGRFDYRDLATFIGYCLQESKTSVDAALPSRRMTVRMELPPPRRLTDISQAEQARTPRLISDEMRHGAVPKGRLGSMILQSLSDLLSGQQNTTLLKRFFKNVPANWVIHLLAEPDAKNVAAALRLVSRGITVVGQEFITRLASTNAGLLVVEARLKSFWREPQIWFLTFAILFGVDAAELPAEVAMDTHNLLQTFPPSSVVPVNKDAMAWILAMLKNGIESTTSQTFNSVDVPNQHADLRTISTITSYLLALHQLNLPVRDLLGSSQNLRRLLRISYPSITSVSVLSPSAELALSKDLAKSRTEQVETAFPTNPIRSRPTMIRSGSSVTLPELHPSRIRTPRRPSSFVLIDKEDQSEVHLSAHFNPAMAPTKDSLVRGPTLSSATDELLELIVAILIDHVSLRKDFSGFGLYFKAPPGNHEYLAFFESYILQRTMQSLWSYLSDNKQLLQTPRTLTNMAKYSLHMAEAVFEGWFIDGAQPLVDFTGNVLDYVQRPEISSIKDVRLCSQAVVTIRTVFLRIVLLRLSELDEFKSDTDTLKFLRQLAYWQTILFAPENQETPFIRLICYVLYTKLVSSSPDVRSTAASLFRMLLVQKPVEAATILVHGADADQKHLSTGFMKLATQDDEELLHWVDTHRTALDQFFLHSFAKHWEEFVEGENKKSEESAKTRLARRKEKLQQWEADYTAQAETLQLADRATGHWRINSHAQDRMKVYRSSQDQQENIEHQHTTIERQHDLLRQPCGLFPDTAKAKWQLDQTEAQDRMRMRLLRDKDRDMQMYQPKRKASQRVFNTALRSSRSASATSADSGGRRTPMSGHLSKVLSSSPNGSTENVDGTAEPSESPALDGDFELVDDPREDEEVFEDKNRKIMRSVKRGDSIKSVYNMSRVIGLEAVEALLIIGRKHLYMRDGMFQRSDHEIVSINSAPAEERDAYIQMISGREMRSSKGDQSGSRVDMARNWPWKDVLSISKRRFLFRDVAIEVFFNDGRSYLLTFSSPPLRNSVYTDIANQAPHIIGPSSTVSDEDQWRLSSLRSPEDGSQTFGNKFVNVFNSTAYNSASRKWARGEISNFHYLMLVNTMAGRTFNDLTQYPVFPWVLADYSSEELDLDDPRSYRDLRKPMGCQQPGREADFRERYQTFAEMGEENPFHYGTHYSSAMIVTSYLIRLQPYVQSYLLLQGGSFDHADRLFDSIERAWSSSSRHNMTDVRELIPEFFYLPEFLSNINGYDFGIKEGSGQAIGDVHLPKWAKGDPHLFIKKHREALESSHVSEHLHEWIDLIFGYKQKGEAALEAVNVFHPLSYHGAKDLDTIDDPVERLATVGMIHNFGQTPHQLFTKPHPRREADKHTFQRLDTQAETLTKLPKPSAEMGERVGSFVYQTSSQRLLAIGPCKLYAPPSGRFFAQWQYADNSLRFFDSDSRKLLGLFEELHMGSISTACFADSKTFLTGGTDSTIGVWDMAVLSNEQIDLRPRTHLFGHRAPVTHLALSRAFSTLVSADSDGAVIVWDLNRNDCVGVLLPADPARRVDTVRVNNLTGRILVCTAGGVARLYTLNGHLLLEQRVCEAQSDDAVTCAAFYEGVAAEWVKAELVFTGHRRGGLVKVWRVVSLDDGSWHLQLIKHLNHADPARENVAGYVPPAVTAVLPRDKTVYVGDETGHVWQWDCLVRQGR